MPGNAAAAPDHGAVAKVFNSLLTLFPALGECRDLQIGCYAGWCQDIGDMPGTRACWLVEGSANVIAALPSSLIGPWLNTRDALGLLAGIVKPSGRQPSIPGAGEGVQVGRPVEDGQAFAWSTLPDWMQRPVR